VQLPQEDLLVVERELGHGPRLEDAITYLDQFALDALPDDAARLLWLCYSLVNASFPVEVWRQPRVPDSGAASLDLIVEPAV